MWCDFACTTWQELVNHLLYKHLDENGLRLSKKRLVSCYCNAYFGRLAKDQGFWEDAQPSPWAKHLERHGGLAAHLLNLAFDLGKKPSTDISLGQGITLSVVNLKAK